MDNLERNEENKAQNLKKWELKEYIEADQVKTILREWLNALEENRDLQVFIKGQNCLVPKDALFGGKTKAEFELKNGEYELELELKWKASDFSSKQ